MKVEVYFPTQTAALSAKVALGSAAFEVSQPLSASDVPGYTTKVIINVRNEPMDKNVIARSLDTIVQIANRYGGRIIEEDW